MKKVSKKTLILTSIITLFPVFAGLFLWNRLPDTIPTHFAMDGTPNGWSSKAFTVFGIPLFLLLVHFICLLFTTADPKYDNISPKIFKLIVWTCPLISVLVVLSSYSIALGREIDVTRYTMTGMGIVFMVIGNYLPKCKQNYTMGIKIPWTLADEDNWNHTHRMAGFLWVIGGLVMIFSGFFQWEWLLLTVIVIITFLPMIYSYLFYRKKQKQ